MRIVTNCAELHSYLLIIDYTRLVGESDRSVFLIISAVGATANVVAPKKRNLSPPSNGPGTLTKVMTPCSSPWIAPMRHYQKPRRRLKVVGWYSRIQEYIRGRMELSSRSRRLLLTWVLPVPEGLALSQECDVYRNDRHAILSNPDILPDLT